MTKGRTYREGLDVFPFSGLIGRLMSTGSYSKIVYANK